MSEWFARRPEPSEFDPYYGTYVDLVPDGDVLTLLATQVRDTVTMLLSLSNAQADFRYAPGKWSIKEVIGHVIDTERVFAYRALRFARGDVTPLAGYEQDDYVDQAAFAGRALPDLLAELGSVRAATVHLLSPLTDEEVMRRGVANGLEFSVRAIAYIIAGHERHHVAGLRERYLPALERSA